MQVRRLPTIVATLAAVALVFVIGQRVMADPNPDVRDTTPITIDATPEPTSTATTTTPTADPGGSVTPRIRDDDDDDGPDDDDDEHDDDVHDDDGAPDDDDD